MSKTVKNNIIKSKLNPNNENLKIEFKKYLTKVKDEKLKESTAEEKIRSIRMYEELFKSNDLEKFDANFGIMFCDHLNSQDIKVITRIKHKNNLRYFFEWLFTNKKIKDSKMKLACLSTLIPTEEEVRLARRMEYVEYPTDEQISKIINIEPDSIITRRNRALIAFLCITGARISAVATAQIQDIDIEKKLFFQDPLEGVHTKKDKYIVTRFFEYNNTLVEIFIEWYKEISSKCTEDNFLFPQITEGYNGDELSKTSYGDKSEFASLIKKICKTAKIPEYHPHSFRHYTIFKALHSVKNGIQLKALSQNVGHEEICTILEQYAKMKPEIYAEVIANLFKCNSQLNNFTDEELIQELLNRQKTRTTF